MIKKIFFSTITFFLFLSSCNNVTMEQDEPLEQENYSGGNNSLKRKNPLKKIGSFLLRKIKKEENRCGDYKISLSNHEKIKFSGNFDTPPIERNLNIALEDGDILDVSKAGKRIFSITFNSEKSNSSTNIPQKISKKMQDEIKN